MNNYTVCHFGCPDFRDTYSCALWGETLLWQYPGWECCCLALPCVPGPALWVSGSPWCLPWPGASAAFTPQTPVPFVTKLHHAHSDLQCMAGSTSSFFNRLPTSDRPFYPKPMTFSKIYNLRETDVYSMCSHHGPKCFVLFYASDWCSWMRFSIPGCSSALMRQSNHQSLQYVLCPDRRSRNINKGYSCNTHLGNRWGQLCTKYELNIITG